MKWLGASFIMIAMTLLGFVSAKRFRDRPRQLRQLKVALQSLEAEIVYGLTPLSEACDHIARQIAEPIATLFGQFSKELQAGEQTANCAWEKALDACWEDAALKSSEKEVLLQFGATLGQHDRQHQQKHIRLAIAHLEREEVEAKDEQSRYEKMLKSLGLLAGLLLVILFI